MQNHSYLEAKKILADLSSIESALGILQWDQEVIMPSGSSELRGKTMATLAALAHEKLTSDKLKACLNAAQKEPLSEIDQANVREALRDVARATQIPESLVREWSETTVRAHEVWVQARKEKNFKLFQPELEKLVSLAKKRASAIQPQMPAYDVLIDEFEPGMTQAQIEAIFEPLKKFLIQFLKQIKTAKLPYDTSWLNSPVTPGEQHRAGEAIVRSMGFDFKRGRLDSSVHPFCGGGGPDDVRITTRYNETAFLGSLMGMIHETGHALYEQGRNPQFLDQPVSRARSMGIHESQSLLWEKQVGQNRAFWEHHFPKLQQNYPFLKSITLDEFIFGVNQVDFNNFIRVDADELTYPLHVILRYEIERDLFSGKLEVKDLPAVWNAKMTEYLGITPPDDSLGVLQDTHWSGGAFGYFPSYTLGALYAAQFIKKATTEAPQIEPALSKGDPQPLLSWLREKIHRAGSTYSTDDLCKRATGETLNPEHFIQYAQLKYSKLYRL